MSSLAWVALCLLLQLPPRCWLLLVLEKIFKLLVFLFLFFCCCILFYPNLEHKFMVGQPHNRKAQKPWHRSFFSFCDGSCPIMTDLVIHLSLCRWQFSLEQRNCSWEEEELEDELREHQVEILRSSCWQTYKANSRLSCVYTKFMCICMLWEGSHSCWGLWIPEGNLGCYSLLSYFFMFVYVSNSLLSRLGLPIRLGVVISKPRIGLSLLPQSWVYKHVPPVPPLPPLFIYYITLHGCWVSNSCPHACSAD